MKLYEVGPKPVVSPRGVSFDTTHPDRYAFISPALELLETLDFDTEKADQHIHQPRARAYSGNEMLEKVKEYCGDIDGLVKQTEEETRNLIEEYESKIQSNASLSADERRAWLGNVASMREYYLQYITNATVYRCLLEKLADEFLHSHIASITFPLRNNYGLVLDDLIQILRDHKPPYDGEIKIEKNDRGLVGKFVKYQGER